MSNNHQKTSLDEAVGRIGDRNLRRTIAAEVEKLRGSRKFGLVFDPHMPESARLPNHQVRNGVTVALRDESSKRKWTVTQFTDESKKIAVLIDSDGNTSEQEVVDLMVVREFGEAVYPGLRSVERIKRGKPEYPWHAVINGENYHVLQALRSTHRGKVDLIYIDPPYNTGNDSWIYNDKYVDANDRTKSSKWLSFMERRLRIARDLLKSTGIIIVAIGDDEHHRLRMLMDQVFGTQNFISDVVWQGGVDGYASYVSNKADYMVIYARSKEDLDAAGTRWRTSKPGVDEALTMAEILWAETKGNFSESTTGLRAWWKKELKTHPAWKTSKHFDSIDSTGRVYYGGDAGAPEKRDNRCFKQVIHPETGKPCPVPKNGWRWEEAELDRRVAAGRLVFGANEGTIPKRKDYLDEVDCEPVRSVFEQDRRAATGRLKDILVDKRFPNPKDHQVLMRWFRLTAPKDAVILDFFGGSGSTTEAVLRLNAEDGGTRQSILVTNNEVGSIQAKGLRKKSLHPGDPDWEAQGVFEYVTRPRISTCDVSGHG